MTFCHCLGGVLIEKAPQGGVYLVASNGHTIAIVYAPDGLLEGFDKRDPAHQP